MSTKFIVLLFTLIIYILIMVSFNKARAKFAGGKIGDVINLIVVTVVLLFIGDYILLFEQFFSKELIFVIQSLFRAAALSFLAFGGVKIASD